MSIILRAVWNYRGFILCSVRREFQSKYQNSLLGATWSVISPLAMIVVYTVVFSQVMQTRIPKTDSKFAYSIYLCAGMLTWGLFAEITSRAQTVFLENANLLKKMCFPRICLPVVVVLNALINFTIIFGLFTIFLLITGLFPGIVYLAVFPLLLIQVVFSVGLGILLGVLNVFFRDVGQFYNVTLLFWFWMTPIVYQASILPEPIMKILAYNPMAALVQAYQDVFVLMQWPDWRSLWFVTLLSIFLCVVGLRFFRRLAGEMVDEL